MRSVVVEEIGYVHGLCDQLHMGIVEAMFSVDWDRWDHHVRSALYFVHDHSNR